MSTSHCSTEVSAPGAFAGFATRTVNKLAALLTAWQNRRVLYAMGQMNDHELSDIGLTRADLYAVDNGPVSQDPTKRLNAIANRELAARRVC